MNVSTCHNMALALIHARIHIGEMYFLLSLSLNSKAHKEEQLFLQKSNLPPLYFVSKISCFF